MNSYRVYRAPDCPGCGKEDAARMGYSGWGHMLSCCSEECGLNVAKALTSMREDSRYKFFSEMQYHANDCLAGLQREYLEALRAVTIATKKKDSS